MNEAIERCDRLLAVYTRNYHDSKACTAEMDGMWRRDMDGRLGRIIIAKLDATEVPGLLATRDYWDFTKIPVENVKEVFLRRVRDLKPIVSEGVKRRRKTAGVPLSKLTTEAKRDPKMNATISGDNNKMNQVGRDYHEHHHHKSARINNILERRGDEIDAKQAFKISEKLKEW